MHIAKGHKATTTLRDYRKLRSNPQVFLNELAKVEWESFVNMEDVDDMEQYWSTQINNCLNITAPWKTHKHKQKRYRLPKDVQDEISKQRYLMKKHERNATDPV